MRGHIKKREWLDGKALSTDPAKRKQQVREITARARAEGRTLAPIRVTYQARIPDPRNRRKDLVKTFDRKRDGERWLASTAVALHSGDYIDPRRGEALFSAVAEEWRGTWADLAPKTRVGYESILNRHLLPEFGRTRVAAITPEAVQLFVNRLAETHAPTPSAASPTRYAPCCVWPSSAATSPPTPATRCVSRARATAAASRSTR